MTYRGRIQGNTVIFDNPPGLPDGTEVVVEALSEDSVEESSLSLAERLGDLIGSIDDLPEDFALNHEHYRYGTPKR